MSIDDTPASADPRSPGAVAVLERRVAGDDAFDQFAEKRRLDRKMLRCAVHDVHLMVDAALLDDFRPGKLCFPSSEQNTLPSALSRHHAVGPSFCGYRFDAVGSEDAGHFGFWNFLNAAQSHGGNFPRCDGPLDAPIRQAGRPRERRNRKSRAYPLQVLLLGTDHENLLFSQRA
ncbi:hypothetical protein [Mesorhizobium muleiense]|uniref:hypothetical protein n=1 Tax=Mesorhizobium muleiense TaxID=1004279 RepID=UPI001F44E2DB|nr:hypothetical protein [Mesorhizobium muleiense]MCF6110833.1 hypothetical protein [Mesorhizobium muleiense]